MDRVHARIVVAALVLSAPMFGGCLDELGLFQGRASPYDIIRGDQYTEWVIEIDFAEGHRPSGDAISLLRSRMTELVDKERIVINVDDQISTSRSSWSQGAVESLSKDHRDASTGGNTVVTHVLYLNGDWEGGSEEGPGGAVLGVAIGHGLVAIFDERVDESAGLLVSATTVESAVLVHEFGHIIGLVDRGIPMRNPHSDGSGHSDNRNSVMYAAVATDAISTIFNGPPPTSFDANDKADVCDAGGRC